MSLVVPVHYDVASSLCYVAHRVLPRLAEDLEALEIELRWTPVDLATLVGGYRRGAALHPAARTNVQRVCRELGVALRMPEVWLDSRRAHALLLAAEREGRDEALRERILCAIFEEGRALETQTELLPLAREVGVEGIDPEGGLSTLAARTAEAREAGVTGVPTFMLGAWPLGGIQDDDTMRRILTRFASRARSGGRLH